MKMIHETHEKHEKKIKIIRVNSCNSWASFFYRLWVRPRHHGEFPGDLQYDRKFNTINKYQIKE
jgi:hypothetical protein